MKTINKITFLLLLFALFCNVGNAQELKADDIKVVGFDSDQDKYIVTGVINNNKKTVIVRLENEYNPSESRTISVIAGEKRELHNSVTCNIIKAKIASGGDYIIIRNKPKRNPVVNEDKVIQEPLELEETPISQSIGSKQTSSKPKAAVPVAVVQENILGKEEVVSRFNNYIESIPFYSTSKIQEQADSIEKYIKDLKQWKDRGAYIQEHRLNTYIHSHQEAIKAYRDNIVSLLFDFKNTLGGSEILDETDCMNRLQAILTERIEQRENNIIRLSEEINETPMTEHFDWKWIGIGAAIAILLLVLFVLIGKTMKKNRKTASSAKDSNSVDGAASSIVIRRKTTSILRKQSLEDVIGNNAYMKVECNDFCSDSAVRRMYIKNTCIKDIYNMYAEDLRNPNNPKEDGCMVLGRWVYDSESREYYVSLEHIVLPGDDAVFSEYELNFGGKIKLKVTEKLRKLRRETNLQYDLTCWVHSHPGLGVFFSNSDSNVQMQLKHPTHPNFLTAIVVDILTPQQEMGIFTFKSDGTINSKADLKKIYSLEELYKWAVESDRNSFKPEDYYNVLADAKAHANDCYGIELSNSAIIDMGMLVAEQNTGLVGMVHGFSSRQVVGTEFVAVTVSKNEAVPDNELVGCFIMATHCSIPSIRKAVASYLGKIRFVLVYTTTDGLLTSIPVLNQDICIDEGYYGEQKLEDLKIWTRRKR